MCFKQMANLLSLGTLPPRCTFVVRSLLIISLQDCREADSRDTSPRHACLGEVLRKIWLYDFAINNNEGSVPVIFISLVCGVKGDLWEHYIPKMDSTRAHSPWTKNLPHECGTRFWLFCSFC